MTTPTVDHPEFVEEDRFTGMIVDDTGTIAAREHHANHVTADGTKQRVFISTHTEDAYRGQGLAGKVVKYTLDKALEEGYRIVAICPYVKSWLDKQDDPRYEQARDTPRPEHFPQKG
jgi:predicted GNAT family acetyltransferase